MPNVHLVQVHDVPPVPWRNGGGLTRELLAWPTAQDWLLRVSVAEIESDGPFSAYPGVERWFVVLHGEGVQLSLGNPPPTRLDTTSEPLRARFRPIAEQAMQNVGLARQYDQLVRRYTALPFASKPKLDLPSFITDRTLAGLFTVIGEEERKIRTNPAARTTELLRQVFGR